METKEMQELIDAAAKGDRSAARKLRQVTHGMFEATMPGNIPPFLRVTYASPDPKLPQSLEELRAKREYDRKVVDEFVSKACDPDFLAPGAAMFLFVLMCTKFHSAFQEFGGEERRKLVAMYRFWDEAHPWVAANILFEMRERLYHEHHRKFCQAAAARARQYDKIVEEGKRAEAAMEHVQQEVANGSKRNHQGDEP